MDIKTITIILLIIGIFGLGSYYYFFPNEIEVEKIVEIYPEEKAEVFTSFVKWGEEIGKQNGYIFTYWINNFGEREAKDVVIECVIVDQNDNVVKRINKNYGNLAPNSMKYDEMYNNIFGNTTEFDAYCLTKSCSNCDVLENDIHDLDKYI